MQEQIRRGVSQPDIFVITHEYVGKGGSEGKAHAHAFNYLIVDNGKEEKQFVYSVFEEQG